MKKILILSNNDAGLYEFRKEVIEAMLADDFEVHISVPDTGHVGPLRELGASLYVTDLDRRGMNPLTDLKLLLEYKRLIKLINPDAVLTYTIKPNVYGGVASKGKPFFPNVTGLGTALQHDGFTAKIIKKMYKRGLAHASCIFFQNEYNLEFMKKSGCIRNDAYTRLLPGSGVNTEEYGLLDYPGEADGKLHLLYVGRIMDDKGSSELLHAAERLSKLSTGVVFDIVGSFEEETRQKYEPWIERLQKQGIVQYHGYHDDVRPFYNSCHGLVHPSYHEGMSNVVLEAAASGRPVITSDIPGCREIYEDKIGGLSFIPKDSDSLTDTLTGFVQMSSSDRSRMGAAARTFVESRFDRKIVIQAYLEEIHRVIG